MIHDKKELCNVLSFTYRMMVASAPLLEFAIYHCAKRSIGGELFDYFAGHLKEEKGHDEMLKEDLLRLGVKDIPVSHAASRLAGSQYYFIAHEHPAMLLGYMRALERDSMPLDQVDAMSKLHGVELKALLHHAEHDPQHAADLSRVIDGLADEVKLPVIWNENCIRAELMSELSILARTANG